MTQAQHKAFSEACSRFGDDLAKIFGTEAPTMERQPLFTTADGVAIYEGDKAFTYYNGNIFEWDAKEANSPGFPLHAYSTREAAEKAYDEWLRIQPVLTLQDVDGVTMKAEHWLKLKELVKDKIAKR